MNFLWCILGVSAVPPIYFFRKQIKFCLCFFYMFFLLTILQWTSLVFVHPDPHVLICVMAGMVVSATCVVFEYQDSSIAWVSSAACDA